MAADLLKKFVHEPLVHFLLLGAAIFAIYGVITKGTGESRGKIIITQGQIASIIETYTLTRQRAPSREELEGLIRDRVREEVYYREALALGMDKDDAIIRRRLQQKMEFVSDGRAPPAEPSEAELQAYLNAHAATLAAEPRFSFRQVYLDPQRHGTDLARDAERIRVALNQAGAKANLASIGDPLLLGHEYDDTTGRELANSFGNKFATALGNLPLGQWQGPVDSGYGAHIVFLAARTGGGTPTLDQVRDTVRREWVDAQQREAAAKSYQALLSKYAVVIEGPSATAPRRDPVATR